MKNFACHICRGKLYPLSERVKFWILLWANVLKFRDSTPTVEWLLPKMSLCFSKVNSRESLLSGDIPSCLQTEFCRQNSVTGFLRTYCLSAMCRDRRPLWRTMLCRQPQVNCKTTSFIASFVFCLQARSVPAGQWPVPWKILPTHFCPPLTSSAEESPSTWTKFKPECVFSLFNLLPYDGDFWDSFLNQKPPLSVSCCSKRLLLTVPMFASPSLP